MGMDIFASHHLEFIADDGKKNHKNQGILSYLHSDAATEAGTVWHKQDDR